METSTRDTDHQLRLPPLRVAGAVHSEQDDCQLREELLSVLLHDLRSPLGAVTVLADLISSSNEKGVAPDTNQIQMLKEAVTRAQRVLDDALEIQSVIRGSSIITTTIIEVDSLVKCCTDRARRAPYFADGQINVDFNHGTGLVRTDLEKAETVLLCAIEQLAFNSEGHFTLSITTRIAGEFLVVAMHRHPHESAKPLPHYPMSTRAGLRGKLGTRTLGESRYSLQVCQKVMALMGGRMDVQPGDSHRIEIRLPKAHLD